MTRLNGTLTFRAGFPLSPLIRPVDLGPSDSSRVVVVVAVVIALPLRDVRLFLVVLTSSLSSSTAGWVSSSILASESEDESESEELELELEESGAFVDTLALPFGFGLTSSSDEDDSEDEDDEEESELELSFAFFFSTFFSIFSTFFSTFFSSSLELESELESELEELSSTDFLLTSTFLTLGFTSSSLELESELEELSSTAFLLTSTFSTFGFTFTCSSSLELESDELSELEPLLPDVNVWLEARSGEAGFGFGGAFLTFFFTTLLFNFIDPVSLDSSSSEKRKS